MPLVWDSLHSVHRQSERHTLYVHGRICTEWVNQFQSKLFGYMPTVHADIFDCYALNSVESNAIRWYRWWAKWEDIFGNLPCWDESREHKIFGFRTCSHSHLVFGYDRKDSWINAHISTKMDRENVPCTVHSRRKYQIDVYAHVFVQLEFKLNHVIDPIHTDCDTMAPLPYIYSLSCV